MYHQKLCELHPEFKEIYKKWKGKNEIEFNPERFNEQYNIFRLVKR